MLARSITRLFYFFSNPSMFVAFRFLFKNNGVVFESDLIQIGVKSEYRQNLGRLGLFYGNKTQSALEVILFPPLLLSGTLSLRVEPSLLNQQALYLTVFSSNL